MLKRIERKENIPDFIKGVKEGNERLMGFGHRVYKNYDPRAQDHQEGDRGRLRGHRQEPAARDRHRARADRARGRVLRQAQALPQRRLLLGAHLRGDGAARRDVPGHVRHRPHERLDRAVARDGRRTPSRRSPARARSTRASASATTCRSSSAEPGAAASVTVVTPCPRRAGVPSASGCLPAQRYASPRSGRSRPMTRLCSCAGWRRSRRGARACASSRPRTTSRWPSCAT